MTLSTAFRTAAEWIVSITSHIALLVFTFLASIYINLSAHTFHDALLRTVPERYRSETATLLSKIERTWKAFFRGELTLMLFIGVISWLGLTALGIPGAPYLGLIAGLLEIVPNIGPVLSTVPAVIVALLQGSIYIHVTPLFMALIVVLFYILVQQLENNLIVPMVLGKAVNLPPLVVMTGVLVGAEVGGLLGIILASPVIATIRDIVSYIYRKILGENPFPPEEEEQTAAVHSSKNPVQLLKEKFVRFGGFRKVPSRNLPKSARD
jgi:predicted PurR-regulated permease PerM